MSVADMQTSTVPSSDAPSSPSKWALLPRGWRWVAGLVACGLVPITLCRMFGIEYDALALIIAFMPWFWPLALVAVIFGLLSRSWLALGLACCLLLLQTAWLVPLFTGSRAPLASGTPLTIMSSNLLHGKANTDEIIALIKSSNVDLLAMQEVTPDAVARLDAAGIRKLLPNFVDGLDNVIYSRLPIQSKPLNRPLPEGSMLGTQIEVANQTINFVDVHPQAPLTRSHIPWTEDQPVLLAELAALPGATVLAGDFNATLDHRIMRDLQAEGYVDAAESAGDGFAPTYPQGTRFPRFPMVTIDHVMFRNVDAGVAATSTHPIQNSDHRALIVTLVLN